MRLKLLLFGCIAAAFNAAAQTNGWTLVWSDEFTQPDGSSPDSAKWNYDIGNGGWGNNELEFYTSRTNNARIENNALVIEALQEQFGGSGYTSARLKTMDKESWTYGRFEVRAKIPRGQGLWPSFWLLGANYSSVGWPACGELDIMENVGREPNIVLGAMHGPGYSGSGYIGRRYTLPSGAFADDFHTFALEWTPNQLKWFIDGFEFSSTTPASLPSGGTWVFNQPQSIFLNVAVGGVYPGYPDGTTSFPQRMTVDYVRVYAPTNLPTCSPNVLANPSFETDGLANWTTFGAGFNTVQANITDVQVRSGNRVFKVSGQSTGSTNESGATQDFPASAGQHFIADGWILTPTTDPISGANTAWLEVSFRDASANVLSLYRSALFSPSTAAGVWLYFAVTNQLNPSTLAVIGSVTDMVAPVGASFARCRVVFRQPATSSGSVLFDDVALMPIDASGGSVPVFAALNGNSLNLSFATVAGQSYQVIWKANLTDPSWLSLTNVTGDGGVATVPVSINAATGFYQVVQTCN